MKIKYKLLTTIIIATIVIFFSGINNVMAVGNTLQSWINVNDDSTRYLLFRTYTAPSESTIRMYNESTGQIIGGWQYWDEVNHAWKESKWIRVTSAGNMPNQYTFKTLGLAFHNKYITSYNETNQANSRLAYNAATRPITSDFGDLGIAVNNSRAVYVQDLKYNTGITDAPRFGNEIFYTIMNFTGSWSNVSYGTGLVINNPMSTGYETEYRYAIIHTNGDNVYVADNIVRNHELNGLIKSARAKGLAEKCYVSDITASGTFYNNNYYNGIYELAPSAVQFFSQYGPCQKAAVNNYNCADLSWGYKWTENPRGMEANAMGSVLNLYDNEIVFPQLTNRQVIVRHINLRDNTILSSNLVNTYTISSTINGENAYVFSKEGQTINLTNPTKTISDNISQNDKIRWSEYYTGIETDQSVTKTAFPDTETYKYLGYNVATSSSYDGIMAQMRDKMVSGTFDGTSRSVTIAAKELLADDDISIIDFYYTEHEKDVYVNHIYVNEDGYVLELNRQTIDPNDTAIMGNVEINNLASGTSVEQYSKKLGYNITTRIADSIEAKIENGENVLYVGYELLNKRQNISSIVGNQINISPNNTDKTVVITGDSVQVNYYYYIDNKVSMDVPARDIGGSVFSQVLGENALIGTCTDNKLGTGFSVTSVPTGITNLRVGIENIPVARIGAINAIYKAPIANEQKIEISINNKTETISYRPGYYVIENMIIHKLKEVTIYDADTTELNSYGENLFNDWLDNKLSLVPKDINVNVTFEGINGVIAKNNYRDKNNYVRVYLKDKNGNSYYEQNGKVNISYSSQGNKSFNEIARDMKLQLVIEVQNPIIKINGEAINNGGRQFVTVNLYNYSTASVTTERPVVDNKYYNNLGMVTANNYTNTNMIASNVLNGIRTLTGKAEYISDMVLGDTSKSKIVDTIYYSQRSNKINTMFFEIQNTGFSKVYQIDNTEGLSVQGRYDEIGLINVYTPITVTSSFKSENNIIVNQTENSNLDSKTIQINTPFTITMENEKRVNLYNIEDTKQFNGAYYVKFDFDVHQVKFNGITHNNGNRIAAGTWIGPIYRTSRDKATITAQAYGSLQNTGVALSEDKSNYTIRAVAYNITDDIRDKTLNYKSITEILVSNDAVKDLISNICDSSSYLAETREEVAIINRVYDFRVTDVKDLNWKNAFRKTSENNTNKHTGNLYYAGTTKWNAHTEKLNEILTRPSSEIGRNPLRILPIGPYKNTDSTYVKAPKLGYRFSFDMKLTGSYNNEKKVIITTDFYYISKDGKTYIEEYNGNGEGIYLFYKNSAGKYIRIDEEGGKYNLSFIPNDGYRYIEDSNKSTLSTKAINIGNLRKITLNNLAATVADNESVITYYGEYKLPNSTIAVKVDKNGKYDINKPLTDGYVGVIFKISAYTGTIVSNDRTEVINLSYSKDTNGKNTSQWDYEGFLGYTNYGKEVVSNTISLRLEKGSWNIDDTTYNKIKGTVFLYDIDERADTDYE